jgi:hypothetical protein
MRRLHYSGGEMLTADQTCKAVLRYARALADNQISDVVSIPVMGEGGDTVLAHLLIGPASQLFSTPVPDVANEPVDDDVVADLERRTVKLQPARPGWPEEMQDIANIDFDV